MYSEGKVWIFFDPNLFFFLFSRYVLVSYDENYPELLKAYGIPSFIVPFILESSETINLSRNGDRFKMVTITGKFI